MLQAKLTALGVGSKSLQGILQLLRVASPSSPQVSHPMLAWCWGPMEQDCFD
eukprot:CAMPEP_0115184018 /NCGR_PEP_ID=MMETSP0270-20121206/8747_1 /TAXON_ID=71861 /ORGANISM="Scrippsiella trochoidea, Strain CCMP3099" /LENGTH=51 /DNA_ID=CAMNT_0002597093 /DNA_START=699 /DNA_END=854 /DNA_ORIENTATION=+